MKRFYKEVQVAEGPDGWRVLLDGKPVKTPARHALALPTEPLAMAIAVEWQSQDEEINAVCMPLLRLANTVIDGVRASQADVIGAILRFGDNDLLCYRAHHPPELVKRQALGWDPLLDWAHQRFSARMQVAEGLNHVDQSPETLAALREALLAYDEWTLAGLHVIASICGSLVLGLAVVEGRISGAHAFELSRIDELYQIEKWGVDEEAQKRATNLAHELDKAVELIQLAH